MADGDGVAQSQGAWGLPAACRLSEMPLLLKGRREECLFQLLDLLTCNLVSSADAV